MLTITDEEWFSLVRKERNTFTGVVKYKEGAILYIKNGIEHREDGPAIETPDGYKEWRIKGLLHRIDGPAIIQIKHDCITVEQYFINGEDYTKELFYKHPEVIKNSKEFQDVLKYKTLDTNQTS